MMNSLENLPCTITIPLMVDGDYITLQKLEGDTVNYSILNNKGEFIPGYENKCYSFDSELSTLEIDIPGVDNTLPIIPSEVEGEDGVKVPSETRTVLISVKKSGMSTYNYRKQYKIIQFVPYGVTEDDVFGLLGVTPDVTSQGFVDVYNAFLQIDGETDGVIKSKLLEGGVSEVKANRAILLKAALSLESVLPLGVPQSESDSIVTQKRYIFELEDFKKMFEDLKSELGDLLDELVNGGNSYVPTIFVVGTVTDPVTGA